MIFKKVPEFSHVDIAAFHSFKADDGQSNGISLRLDFRGTNALELLTRMRQGEVLLPIVNGVPMDLLSIDAPVHDGIITIWKGVPDAVVAELAKKYPPIKELAPVSKGDKTMVGTTRKEKSRVMEDYRIKQEEDRVKGNKAARKAEKDALNPAAEPELPTR